MKDLPGPVLALAFLGGLCVLFATYAGLWYVAQHMAWWTFSLFAVGCVVGWAFVKGIFKTALSNNGSTDALGKK